MFPDLLDSLPSKCKHFSLPKLGLFAKKWHFINEDFVQNKSFICSQLLGNPFRFSFFILLEKNPLLSTEIM